MAIICQQCRCAFKGRPNARYCSDACRQAAYRERVKAVPVGVCLACGNSFDLVNSMQLYCGDACRQLAYRRRRAYAFRSQWPPVR